MTTSAQRPFPLLQFLGLTLLLAPFVMGAVVWFAYVLRAASLGPDFSRSSDSGMDWMTVVVGAGVVGVVAEWILIPLLLGRGETRRPLTLPISLGIGLAVAVLIYILLGHHF